MNEPLKVNDNISIYFASADGQMMTDCKVVQVPKEGDELLYVEHDGITYGVNTRSNNFCSLTINNPEPEPEQEKEKEITLEFRFNPDGLWHLSSIDNNPDGLMCFYPDRKQINVTATNEEAIKELCEILNCTYKLRKD